MVKQYQLLYLLILGSIHFARGQFPQFTLDGTCRTECEETEDEVKGLENCDNSEEYCVSNKDLYWSVLKNLFEFTNGFYVLTSDCLTEGTVDGSIKKVAGAACKKTCQEEEVQISGKCHSQLNCCKKTGGDTDKEPANTKPIWKTVTSFFGNFLRDKVSNLFN